jgi:hypothetical protein
MNHRRLPCQAQQTGLYPLLSFASEGDCLFSFLQLLKKQKSSSSQLTGPEKCLFSKPNRSLFRPHRFAPVERRKHVSDKNVTEAIGVPTNGWRHKYVAVYFNLGFF